MGKKGVIKNKKLDVCMSNCMRSIAKVALFKSGVMEGLKGLLFGKTSRKRLKWSAANVLYNAVKNESANTHTKR
jgi:hypothetical protein